MTDRLPELWQASPVAFWLVVACLAYYLWMAARLAVIDIRSHLLPNRIVLPSYWAAVPLTVAAVVAAGGFDAGAAVRVLGGGAVLWLVYFVLRVVYPAGMGFGDVKLAGVLGLYLGFLSWQHLFWGTAVAFLLGGLYGLGLIVTRRGTAKSAIPFGPFMLAGTAIALVLPA
ncbi:leader peptidase (prepilin peptidase)/N-methyltransferase [Sinomonas atrocyanea]|uniref:prepilin peptidase n=1 Tax=Sinomonas atrocyanea TaxID=37927 RepID=UPI002787C523|nr:A24 family peptidase [Sinomonas atrocyanea]MDP9883289.1 leader peptidase (prepilin peptidase)/N-methyltransferase [Sinomonas atrocyanea]